MRLLRSRGGTCGTWPARRRRGQAVVEMAIVMMILLTLTFGIADFGIYMYRYVQAANCVREAARRYVVHDASYMQPETYCVDASLQPTVVEVDGDAVATLDVAHDWVVMDILIPGLGGTGIHARAAMRIEPEF